MRVFIAAWPPEHVLAALRALPRPDVPDTRWTREQNWHVTLRFLGEIEDHEAAQLPELLRAVAPPARAQAGPATVLLNPSILVVPVRGVDALARAVLDVTAGIGEPAEPRPFRGHLTIARARGRGRLSPTMAGEPIACDWIVDEIAVVQSRPHAEGSDYETVATIRL